MPLLLLDTDVLIEMIRSRPAAVAWMKQNRSLQAGVPGFAALELIAGCSNRLDVKRVEAFIARFPIYWPSYEDLERAHASFAEAHLTHRIGIVDMVIAHTAVGYDATLTTFNQRHFDVVGELQTQRPYTR